MWNCKPPSLGRTKKCWLWNIIFWDKEKTIIQFGPRILEAYYITIAFEDQKNIEKFEKRTQQCTNDRSLCPLLHFGRIILRILWFIPPANKDTFVCATMSCEVKMEVITSDFTLKTIYWCCKIGGKEEEFGFSAREMGKQSIHWGVAMALFLTNKHPARIMLLGWWKSLAFLKYIRAQTVEWILNMSESMTNCWPLWRPNNKEMNREEPEDNQPL